MRTQIPFVLLAVAFACTFATAPAHARARVFVASYGNDANPCTFGSPCKTFQQAVNVVDAGGEVTAIDSAGFGPINITKSVSITSPAGVEAGIVPTAGGNAITIAAGAENEINLRGLIIEGSFTGATGIVFSSGGTLTIQDTVVRDFIDSGIGLTPNSSAHIAVSNTSVINNGGDGIFLQPSGGQPVYATFNRVEAYHNSLKGIGIFANALGNAHLMVAITDSVAAYNTDGFYFLGAGNSFQFVSVNRSTTTANVTAGIHADNFATIFVSQTNLFEDNTTWLQENFSCIASYGNNYTLTATPATAPCGPAQPTN